MTKVMFFFSKRVYHCTTRNQPVQFEQHASSQANAPCLESWEASVEACWRHVNGRSSCHLLHLPKKLVNPTDFLLNWTTNQTNQCCVDSMRLSFFALSHICSRLTPGVDNALKRWSGK